MRIQIRGAAAVTLAVIILVSAAGRTNSDVAPTNSTSPPQGSPEEVVRQFYDWYLHAGLPSPERKNLATFREYVTQRLIKKQMDPEVDADLFVDNLNF
ncbi:MAG: hypothetical protein M3R69_18465 [Acidobacteriota bacterium]|nr:hypothetical protein [Acidobacteriota bacterium]